MLHSRSQSSKRSEPSRCIQHRNGSDNQHTSDMPTVTLEIPQLTSEQQGRFWSKVNKNGPLPDQSNPHYLGLDECWEWTAGKVGLKTNYGRLAIGRQLFLAHRIAFHLCGGLITPENPHVLHRCDFGPCCNPRHLWAGTEAENNADKERKNRANHPTGDANGSRTRPDRLVRGELHHSRTKPECLARGDSHGSKLHPELCPRGETNGMSKLTDEKVREMRSLNKSGISQKRLGKMFGVTQPCARFAILGITWKHVQ